jgi:hypothetical protein
MFRTRRPRGGQIGNRNGLKHGFYSRSTQAPEERDSLAPEAFTEELERLMAVTRKTIRSLLAKDTVNDRLLSYNLSLLERLIRRHAAISRQRADRHRQAVEDLGRRLSITSGPNRSQDSPC